MTWATAYLGCFVLGLTVVGLTVLLGQFGGSDSDAGGHGALDAGDADADVGGGGHGHLHLPGHAHLHAGDAGAVHMPLFSPTVLAVFVGMFGAAGYAMTAVLGITAPIVHVPVSGGISVGTGLSVAWILMKLMKHAESNTRATHAELVGRVVEIHAAIRAGEFGEIAYEAGGARQTMIARSDEGAFAQGDAAQVVRVVEGTAWVARPGAVAPLEPVEKLPEGRPVPKERAS